MHRGKRLPARADLEPMDIPQLLPHLMLIEVHRESSRLRFRFRLIGSAVCQYAGRNWTGRYLDDPDYGPGAKAVTGYYTQVVDSRQPFRGEQFAPWYGKEYQYYERLALPLSSDGENVDMVLSALDLIERPFEPN